MGVGIRLIILYVICFTQYNFCAPARWTWVYTKEFSLHEHSELKDEVIVYKDCISPFTQLIFSWNAYRPTHGYFIFWVQGKDAQTGLWGNWHKMMMWGAAVQCSYLSNPDVIAQHHHVRFEACTGKKMNGFRIKVTAHNGANVRLVHAITAAYSDLSLFTSEHSSEYRNLASVKIKKVPRKSQFTLKHPEKHRLCSPTSCAILVEYFCRERCNMHTLANNVFDKGLDSYGSWPFNMAHAFELSQGMYWWRVIRMNSFQQLYAMLQKGYPVAVSIRGMLPGAPKSYNQGHLVVVIGYEPQTQSVICNDPACPHDRFSVRKYALSDFLSAWEKSHRLAYCASKRTR